MIKKLQLVALGWVVFQGAGLVAMDNKKEKKVMVEHAVATNMIVNGAKRRCVNLPAPRYVVLEKLDWLVELKRNPHLEWLPI